MRLPKKVGNLFFLAETQLIKEKKQGLIPCYTLLDIIEYAILIRKFLDRTPPAEIRKILQLTEAERKKRNNEKRRRYYLRTGK